MVTRVKVLYRDGSMDVYEGSEFIVSRILTEGGQVSEYIVTSNDGSVEARSPASAVQCVKSFAGVQ